MNTEGCKVIYDYDVTSAKRNEEPYGRFSKGQLIFGLASQTAVIVKKKATDVHFFVHFHLDLKAVLTKQLIHSLHFWKTCLLVLSDFNPADFLQGDLTSFGM